MGLTYAYVLLSDAIKHAYRAAILLMACSLVIGSTSMMVMIKLKGHPHLQHLILWAPTTATGGAHSSPAGSNTSIYETASPSAEAPPLEPGEPIVRSSWIEG